jgi:hypothetical protein
MTSSSISPAHKHPGPLRKEVVLSTERIKNGPRDMRDRSGKSNTSAASGTKLSWVRWLTGSNGRGDCCTKTYSGTHSNILSDFAEGGDTATSSQVDAR